MSSDPFMRSRAMHEVIRPGGFLPANPRHGVVTNRPPRRCGAVLSLRYAAQRASPDIRSGEHLMLEIIANNAEIDVIWEKWQKTLEPIRAELNGPVAPAMANSLQRAKHVLEAHLELAAKNEKNADAFAGVVAVLESDLKEKLKEAGSSPD